MNITTPYGTLQVDEQTRIALTITNPMFAVKGSHSLPFTVPLTDHNLKTLGYPQRVWSAQKAAPAIKPVRLMADRVNEVGALEITDITDRIEVFFATREGEFWRWANQTWLKDLSFPAITGATANDVRVSILATANQPYPSAKFAVFPVQFDMDADYRYLIPRYWESESDYNENYRYRRILNSWSAVSGSFVNRNHRPAKSLKDFSPFVLVNYLIDVIFETAGLVVTKNDLTSIDELNRLCILNNTCFAIQDNALRWDLLMPNITVNDFISTLFAHLNVNFTIDFSSRTCQIELIDELIRAVPSSTINGQITILSQKHKEVEISQSVSSDEYVKPAQKTIDEYIADLGVDYEEANYPFDMEDDEVQMYTSNDTPVETLVYNPSSQFLFYDKKEENKTGTFEETDFVIKRLRVGALTQPVIPDGEDKVSYKSDASVHSISEIQVPTVFVIQPVSTFIGKCNNSYLFAPFFPDKMNDITTANDILMDKSKGFPLIFSIYRGECAVRWSNPAGDGTYTIPSHKQPFGSCYPFDRYGTRLDELADVDVYPDTLSLQIPGENGLLERFFKVTQQFYANSGLPFSLKYFDPKQIVNIDTRRKYLVDNTAVFFTSIKITLSLSGISVDDVEGLTAKPLLDS